MRRAAPLAALLASLAACLLLLHGTSASERQRVELLRLLSESPWLGAGARWRASTARALDQGRGDRGAPAEPEGAPEIPELDVDTEDQITEDDNNLTENSEKRSAVATALNAGRRRRQPSPALGVLNDVGSFFDSLRDNLETLAALTPQQRATLMHEPSVVRARQPSSSTRIGGASMRRMFPTRITGNIRSYNRRSFVEAEGYPAANHHDPAFLWTGLGR